MNKFLSFILLFVFAFATVASAQSFKIIVNEANPTSTISKSDLSDIFLKKKTKWDDGTTIIPVDLNAQSAVREAFSQALFGRGVGAIRSYWQQAAFSGSGTAPIEKGGDADVISFIKANTQAIGYVSPNADTSGLKVIDVN